jgi:hypothetical protein
MQHAGRRGAVRVLGGIVSGLLIPAVLLGACASAPKATPRTAAVRQLDLESFDYVWKPPSPSASGGRFQR